MGSWTSPSLLKRRFCCEQHEQGKCWQAKRRCLFPKKTCLGGDGASKWGVAQHRVWRTTKFQDLSQGQWRRKQHKWVHILAKCPLSSWTPSLSSTSAFTRAQPYYFLHYITEQSNSEAGGHAGLMFSRAVSSRSTQNKATHFISQSYKVTKLQSYKVFLRNLKMCFVWHSLHVSLHTGSLAMNFFCILTLNLALSLLKPKGMLPIRILLMGFTNNCSVPKTSAYFLNISICNEKQFWVKD